MKIKKSIFTIFLFIILLFIPKINNYDLFSDSDKYTKNINLDEFISGNINNNTTIIYNLYLFNDSEQIFFDFQSEYGCLYINIENGTKVDYYHFIFCSEGVNNIFILNKTEILDKIGEQNQTIKDLNLTIKIDFNSLELETIPDFDYSLKVSLRKPDINIFEINSEHKMLCKPEKIDNLNYKCIFIIKNNNFYKQNENLIIHSTSNKKNIEITMYSDYINKEIYDNWNVDYLLNNIPNKNSNYTNLNTENNFIIIPNLNSDKYIYLSIELDVETTIEIFSQVILYQDEIVLSDAHFLKIYSIKNDSNYTGLDFNNLLINEISLSLITLYGKASIHLFSNEAAEYITDIRENKIIFNINLDICKINNNCKLNITKLEEDDEQNLGYIFYIYYRKKANNIINEIEYGNSNKLIYSELRNQIILYQPITNIKNSININLQLYNIPYINPNFFDIEILFLPKKEIYNIKLNNSNISNIYKYNNIIKSKFDPILYASNIYVNFEQIKIIKEIEDPYIIICISNNTDIFISNNLIIGLTISQINSLIYPSERIYHYGQLNNEERIVYKLKGKNKYHLMRLEIGINSYDIGWSVKRNNINNYTKNDSDLSFVSEKWINGRELLTMYIENGENIYLTIFHINKIQKSNLTNYIFKYINSGKNGDFKNYFIKYDSLNYNKNKKYFIIN